LAEIDVGRDLLDIQFDFLNEQEDQDYSYTVEISKWQNYSIDF